MKKYIVFGLGISGKAAVKFLLEKGYKVLAGDDKKEAAEALEKHKNLSIIDDINSIKWKDVEAVILAAGIPFKVNPHKIVVEAQKNKCRITCDVEILYEHNCYVNFIGITGTNGKSTTTAITDFIFTGANKVHATGGNIGIAALSLPPLDMDETYILEMSSYQLDLIDKTRFRIANLINITPDHLDRYANLEDYIASKKRIFMNQIEGDYAIINIDNPHCKKIFDELKADPNFKAKLIPLSTKDVVEEGISVMKRHLYNGINVDLFMLPTGERKNLKGEHNAQNIGFAFANAFLSEIEDDSILKSLKQFKGLPHRMQFVGGFDKFIFVNDSKATNADSTESALKSYDNIYWILGGKAKEGGITSLEKYFPNINSVFLVGEATDEFAKILEGKVQYFKCGNLENAFKTAFEKAKKDLEREKMLDKREILKARVQGIKIRMRKRIDIKDKNIILSPAAASFDQWKNFEERGDFFVKLVEDILPPPPPPKPPTPEELQYLADGVTVNKVIMCGEMDILIKNHKLKLLNEKR